MGAAHFRDVIDPEKLGEVIINGRLAEMTTGGAVVALGQGLPAQ